MKKVISGKLYNTETAIEICGYETSGLGMGDFRYEQTALYVTQKRNFFLAGKGHAMSRWASHSGSCSGWGEGMQALTPQEALQWIEQHNCIVPEDYMNAFFSDYIEEA